jgi:hypothetical protein
MYALLLAAGIVLGLPMLTEASPSIVWSGIQDIHIGGEYIHWDLDLDDNGIDDFIFDYVIPGPDFVLTTAGANSNTGPLMAGTMIDSSRAWTSGVQTLAAWRVPLDGPLGCAGPWCGISNGYMGLQFEIDGSTHYGWARLTVEEASPSAILHEWAYESLAGVGLNAGVVPEPSTIILLSVGAVVVGLGWWKTQR